MEPSKQPLIAYAHTSLLCEADVNTIILTSGFTIVPKQHSLKKVNKQKKVNMAKNGAIGSPSREARSCISWLHISDWHQGLPDFDRSVLLQGMLEDIRARSSFDSELSDIDL